MRKIVLTNDTELSLKLASTDLTCRILLDYYFSDVAVSCFNNLQSNRKVKNQFAKKGHVTTETFISLRTRHVAALFWIRSAFATEMAHSKALANSESSGEAATHLLICVKRTCTVHIHAYLCSVSICYFTNPLKTWDILCMRIQWVPGLSSGGGAWGQG